MSGHNKWQQIKHKKAITDAKKGKLFSKLVREIMVAARTGPAKGGAEANIRLRAAVERARREGLPRDNIDRAVAKAAGNGEGVDLKEFIYEATGPGGVTLVIEGITDNTNRSFGEVRHILSDRGARMADPGSVLWNFQKVGILSLGKEENAARQADEIEMAIIDAGARNFETIEDGWVVETDFAERDKTRVALEQQGIIIHESGHDYKPQNTIVIENDTRAKIEQILDALDDQDDVQEIYTNLGN